MNALASWTSRLILVIAVVPAILSAAAVALLTLGLSAKKSWDATEKLFDGKLTTTAVKTDFVGLVSLTLTSVVFLLVGLGLYSLFIAPQFRMRGLHVQSLADLEIKILNVIVVVLATTFLERFTSGVPASELMRFAVGVAIVTTVVLAFQLVLREHVGRRAAAAAKGEDADDH
ncbi:MAG: YqhA family protein [Dehalococcoidia bacterium]